MGVKKDKEEEKRLFLTVARQRMDGRGLSSTSSCYTKIYETTTVEE